MARRRRRFESGLPPPAFAAMMISFASLVNRLPRLASCAPLRRRILCHFECPDIGHNLLSGIYRVCVEVRLKSGRTGADGSRIASELYHQSRLPVKQREVSEFMWAGSQCARNAYIDTGARVCYTAGIAPGLRRTLAALRAAHFLTLR